LTHIHTHTQNLNFFLKKIKLGVKVIFIKNKKAFTGQALVLRPVIPATQEAEIRRIEV
jgi:hypothetical protein